jgi:O-antigen biosynthesis protein WbqP
MASADVLVLPSYREGFGSVIIESAACGIPSIAYRTNGVIDAIDDGVTGLLCNKGDVTDLLMKMELFALSSSMRKNYGEAALLRAKEKFSTVVVVDAWNDLYASLPKGFSKYHGYIKRIFDLYLSLIALPFLMIPMILIALLVLITSKGPVLHWSRRVGKKSQIFLMPKFRTMKVGTPVLATHLMERPELFLTPIGSILRTLSLDEFPQIFSVISGNMSLVGPRPALDSQSDLIQLRIDYGIDQLRPGLTGWAQINGRDDLLIEKKVAFDLEYLDKCSLFIDIYILYKTFFKVIQRDGITH